MTNDLLLAQTQPSILPVDTTDEMLIEMWLHGRGEGTQKGYRKDLRYFLEFTRVMSTSGW